jgi:carbon storage regulator
MLVLSRKRDEVIMIGDDISIIVVDIQGDKVRLGVEAPHEIPVHRQEVYDAIHREDEEIKKSKKAADALDASDEAE